MPAIAGVEAYHINPTGDGFGSETLYVVELVSLNPFGTPGSSFTVDNVFAILDVFGVRVITSGLGANDIAVTVLEKGANGQIIDKHVLEGELTQIEELLFAYVANVGNSTVSVINTGTNTVVTTIPLPAGSDPFGIAITPDGTRAYVANAGTPDSVAVINTATNTILTTIPFPAGSDPFGIAITPDGSRAYVANFGTPDSVTVINTATNTILTTIVLPAGSNPQLIAITPDGSRAYVANDGNATVTVLDTAMNAIIATLPAGSSPFGIAITPILLF
jgi:YVTN family beta-propeller protein